MVIGCLLIFGLQDNVVEWIDIDTVAEILNNELLRSAVYIVIGAGGLVFLMAVCGCLGAILSSKCLLGLVSTSKKILLTFNHRFNPADSNTLSSIGVGVCK